jgi:probable HAF family extracellular repeat protein
VNGTALKCWTSRRSFGVRGRRDPSNSAACGEPASRVGVLTGDLEGAGLGMNNRGGIVGVSVSAPGPGTGNPRAFLWQNGLMRT